MAGFKDKTCIVGVGETKYSRGTGKNYFELALEASVNAIADAGINSHDIDGVVLPHGAGSGTAGDYIANLGLPDLHYTASLQEMGGACCVSSVEAASIALTTGACNYALIPISCLFYSGRKARASTV